MNLYVYFKGGLILEVTLRKCKNEYLSLKKHKMNTNIFRNSSLDIKRKSKKVFSRRPL